MDDVCLPIVVDHEGPDSMKNTFKFIRRIDLGCILMNPVEEEAVFRKADLRWGLGNTVIFAGFVASERPAKLEVRANGISAYRAHSFASDFIH